MLSIFLLRSITMERCAIETYAHGTPSGMAMRMNSRHDPAFNTVNPTRKRCPVCNQAVYSLAGIHPQCAMLQADPPKPRARKPTQSDPAPAVALAESD